MADPSDSEEAAFVTFYSFKGGVGRSMALINVAGILAGRGFRVLALDMDLEAPGISYLMRHEAKREEEELPGFIDLLADACERGEDGDLFALDPQQVVERYSYTYTVPDPIRQSEDGLLRIMPAGRFDGQYQERLDGLDLGQLYRDGQGQPLVEVFKQVVRASDQFDFVFIDSRTGFSDESGICTRDLGDYLVVVMGLNRQNQEGTVEFLHSLRQTNVKPKGLRVVLSPVPNGEDELVEERENQASEALSEAYGDKVSLELQIPYHPRLALTEEPHIFRRSRGYLYEAYVEIERAALEMLGMTPESLRIEVDMAVKAKSEPEVLSLLKRMIKLDGGVDALTGVAVNAEKFITSDSSTELRKFFADHLPGDHWVVGHLAAELSEKKNGDARMFYQSAIESDPEDSDILEGYARFLWHVCGDMDGAENSFQRAIKRDPNNAGILGTYALYLEEICSYHKAEEMYLCALKSDSKDARNLGNYANFLLDIRGDFERAEEYSQRSLVSDPYNAIQLGNYAKMLLITGRDAEGEAKISNAWEGYPEEADLKCELLFYGVAHLWKTRPDDLSKLKSLLEAGHNSKDWPLEKNVERAREAGHPHPEFVAALAEVVSGKARVETLEEFEVWRAGKF